MSVEEILIKLIEAVDPNAYKVKSRNEAMTSLHSLLISKLPDTPENKAVLAEMFRSGDES